jgi:predicted GNAT family acetyltransferase
MNLNLVDVASKKRYEAIIDGSTAYIEYIKAQDKIYLTHTEVPKSMEGKGIGSALVLKVLEDIEKKNLTLIPLCPFVALYLKRHPEWKKLVMKGINIGD